MGVDLDQETARVIADEIEAGRSSSADEFVRRAVKHFVIARELGEEYTVEEIQAKIDRGMSSLDRGEGVDGDAFLDDLLAEIHGGEQSGKEG